MNKNVLTKKRTAKIFFLFFAVFFFFVIRLVWIQLLMGEDLQTQALDNRLREVKVEAKRGVIYDRNMRELAISVNSDYIYAVPPQIIRSGTAKETARVLAELLEISEENLYTRITRQGSWFEYIARKVDFEKSDKIKDLNLTGVYVAEESQRFYPNDYLAAHLLGFAGIDNQGLEGLEVKYDKELSGERGSVVVEYDAVGREIPHALHSFIPPVDGNNLVLTIDETIQYITERELDILMASSTNPTGASIIVMDPQTGEVLALANRPTFNPNEFNKFPQSTWRNNAVANVYEPGSTFKSLITAIILEEGLVAENETFYDPGYINVGAETIRCWSSNEPHGTQTFLEGIQNSCNTVFIELGLKAESKSKGLLYDYLYAFGLRDRTGIDLPGEARSIMIPGNELRPVNVATISIGQGIAITPMQLITAFSAIANDGYLLKPYLVKEIRDSDNNIIKKNEPEIVRQVVSKKTAEETLHYLEEVVIGGTSRNAYIEGYRVGGKTGTAQKPGPSGYLQGKYISSFLGVAPIDDPRLAVLVIIDEPQGYPYYGGTIATPIFKKVVEESLHYLGVPAQYNPEAVKDESDKARISLPDLRGLEVDNAEKALRSLGLFAELQGSGIVVEGQYPEPAEKVKTGEKITLFLKEELEDGFIKVPDVTGYRTFQAARLLEAMGFRMLPQGSGWAVEQDPVPNTKVESGSAVKVLFKEINNSNLVGD